MGAFLAPPGYALLSSATTPHQSGRSAASHWVGAIATSSGS
ncbi:MAG: hypothetical protein WC091_06110 [Sulfuricellaceae bacterium]